jgi:hypothetical protein
MTKLFESIRLLELKHDVVDENGLERNAAQLNELKEFMCELCSG